MPRGKDNWYSTHLSEPVLPSQCAEYAWIYFKNAAIRPYMLHPGDVGKWLVYRSLSEVDVLWPALKVAVHQQKLGIAIKALPRESDTSSGNSLICVYTKDWHNIEDIKRVLISLRTLGISEKLYYKADSQTRMHIAGSIYCSPYDDTIELTSKGKEWYELMHEPLPVL